jgi:TonB family protein
MRLPTLAPLAFALAVQTGPPQDEAARVREAGIPARAPTTTVGAGEVVLELNVTDDGRVDGIDRLRSTVPFTDMVVAAVGSWRFVPAIIVTDGRARPTASKVLVAALYRPPALYMGGTLGEQVRELAPPSGLAPAVLEIVPPPYPPNAKGDGTVLMEVELGTGGDVADVKVMHSGGSFDMPAMDAARRWRFAPPRSVGPSRHYAYVIVGFREPIAPPTPPKPEQVD